VRAVWSFWAKPFRLRHNRVWLSERHHLFSWVLSVGTVREHFTELALVTDEDGARLLVNGLGLEFTSVSTALSALKDANPDWWVLGKLWTYRAQTEPFVHLDNDVFLWKPLPERLQRASVFAQNPENFSFDEENWYRPLYVEHAIRAVNGWAPEEWLWFTSGRGNRAACCGILGGTALDFIAHYADSAIRMIQHPANEAAWRRVGGTVGDNILMEQYLLAACMEFHRGRNGSRYRRVEMQYVFPSAERAFDEGAAARAGYTHLIGGAKRNVALLERLEQRVQRDYPNHYEKCLRLAVPRNAVR
jgi:hypothetical protein